MFQDIVSYTKDIFTEGKNWIFTLFDLLGIVLFLFPHLAQGIESNDKHIQDIGIAIVLISYTLGNFVLYKKNKIKTIWILT
jgi:hypothetical protein